MMPSKGGAQICIALYFKIDCGGSSFDHIQKLISPLKTAFLGRRKIPLKSLKVPEPSPVPAAERPQYSQGPGASTYLKLRQSITGVYLHTWIEFANTSV